MVKQKADVDADDLFFGSILQRAELLSLFAIVDAIAKHVGYSDPDGLSSVDVFYVRRKIILEKLFRSLEDSNPSLAARLHEKYENARTALGDALV